MSTPKKSTKRIRRKPKKLCKCSDPLRVDLVRLKCGDLAWKRNRHYQCPEHGVVEIEAPAWSYCYGCRRLIE